MARRLLTVLAVVAWVVSAATVPLALPAPVAAAHLSASDNKALSSQQATCSASSSDNPCANAIDGDDGTIWSASGATVAGDWLAVTLAGGAQPVTGLRVYQSSGYTSNWGAREFVLEYFEASAWQHHTTVTPLANDTGIQDLADPVVTAEQWRVRATVGGPYTWVIATFGLYVESPPEPTPTPTPEPGQNPTAEPTESTGWSSTDDPALQQCSYETIGSVCTYSRGQYGRLGTDYACDESESGFGGSEGEPWLSCAYGNGTGIDEYGRAHLNCAVTSLDYAAGFGYECIYSVGTLNAASSLRAMMMYRPTTGGSRSCLLPNDAWNGTFEPPPFTNPTAWGCYVFPELGAFDLVLESGDGTITVLSPEARKRFRAAGPGRADPAARCNFYAPGCEHSATSGTWESGSGSWNSQDFDYASEMYWRWSGEFTGRAWIRVQTELTEPLSEAEQREDPQTPQSYIVSPMYASLPSTGWFSQAAVTDPAYPGPPGWQVCGRIGMEQGTCDADGLHFPAVEDMGEWPECYDGVCLGEPGDGGFGGGGSEGGGGGSGSFEKPPWAAGVICAAPSVALDAVGWLSYIACVVASIPGQIITGLQWLMVPGPALGDAYEDFIALCKSRVPFGWFAQISDTVSTSLGASASSLPALTFSMAGVSINAGDSIVGALDGLTPYRGLILAGFALVMVLGCLRWVMASVGVSPSHSGGDAS